MSDSYVRVAPDSTGKLVDACQVTTSSGTVVRQGVCVGDPTDGAARCAVRLDGEHTSGDYALAVHVRQLLDVALAVLQPLRHVARALALAPDPTTGRIRVLVDAITGSLTLSTLTTCTTVTTVTTCATVTSVSQIAGFEARGAFLYSLDRANWAQSVRARIS